MLVIALIALSVGVLKAIPRFDPERGTKFLTYATYWIVKHINLFIEVTDCNKTIKNKETDEEYPVTFTSFDDDTDDYDGETNAEYIERTLFEREADIYRNTPENVFFKEKKIQNRQRSNSSPERKTVATYFLPFQY